MPTKACSARLLFSRGRYDPLTNGGILMRGRRNIILLSLVLLAASFQCKKADAADPGEDTSKNLRDLTVVFVGASIKIGRAHV
jgi:hypothetical protein